MKFMRKSSYRRILPVLLLALLVFVAVPLQARAATTGKCGENLTYTYENGTLTISGTGLMADYSDDWAPWAEEEFYEVVIEEGVTSVGVAAFERMESLETVEIADSVTRIGLGAFNGCSSLVQIALPENLKTIENMAFAGCSNLEWIEIPESLETLGAAVFMECSSLSDVNVPGSVGTIPINCFNSCTSLESMVIEEGITLIDELAFFECTALESVYIPKSVTTVGYCAFYNCSALKHVQFGGFECAINNKAFEGVTAEVYYLVDPKTGDHVSTQNYGGTLTWINPCGQGHFFSPDYQNGKVCLVCGAEKETKLPAPTLTISANTTTGKPKLSWNKIDGAVKYRVYRSTKKTSGFEYLKSTQTATSFTDTTAKAGTNYYYKVKAYHSDSSANSDWSNVVNRVCDLAKPTVSITGSSSSGKPIVKWETVEGAAKYRVYRSTKKTSGFELVYTGVTARSYTDKTAEAGTLYYYKVKAVHSNSSADSAYSETLARTCDLARPNVTIKLSNGNPRLTWEKISGAEKYYVYRATSRDGKYTHVKTTKTASSFTDTTAEAGTTYYYRVKAIHSNTSANSAYSAVDYIKAK